MATKAMSSAMASYLNYLAIWEVTLTGILVSTASVGRKLALIVA